MNALPQSVASTAILTINDQFAAGLNSFRIWPDAFEFTITMRVLGGPNPDMSNVPVFNPRGGEDVYRAVELTVEYSDGRVGSSADWDYLVVDEDPGPGPVMSFSGGGSMGGRVEMRFLVWPLPPEGSITFRFSWPGRGVEGATALIDAGELLAARAGVTTFWT